MPPRTSSFVKRLSGYAQRGHLANLKRRVGNLGDAGKLYLPDCQLQEFVMLKKIALAAFTITIFGSAAIAAEYYVVREKTTQKCKVVETRPTETTWIQVGPLAFKTREEADKQIAVICKEKRN